MGAANGQTGGRCLDAQRGSVASGRRSDGIANPWSFDRDLKKGQALQIALESTCFWEAKDFNYIPCCAGHFGGGMVEGDGQTAPSMKFFITGIEFPNPLVSEVYKKAQNVMKEARCRGHGVVTAMSLENGWEFPSKSRLCQCQGREALLLGACIPMWALFTADESQAVIWFGQKETERLRFALRTQFRRRLALCRRWNKLYWT